MAKCILFVFVVCLFVIFLPAAITQCDEGWTYFDDQCYLIVEEHKYWDDAYDHCQQEQAYLIEILSNAEFDFVQNHLLHGYQYNTCFWNAGYLDKSDCSDVWRYHYSGESVPWNYWGLGQPSYMRTNYCITMTMNGLQLGFYVQDCRDQYCQFVCEKNATRK